MNTAIYYMYKKYKLDIKKSVTTRVTGINIRIELQNSGGINIRIELQNSGDCTTYFHLRLSTLEFTFAIYEKLLFFK
jgi:hypothetical protein